MKKIGKKYISIVLLFLLLVFFFLFLFYKNQAKTHESGIEKVTNSLNKGNYLELEKKSQDFLDEQSEKLKNSSFQEKQKLKNEILFAICMKAISKIHKGEYEIAFSYTTQPEIEGITTDDLHNNSCLLYIKGTVFLYNGKLLEINNKSNICSIKTECLQKAKDSYQTAIEKLPSSLYNSEIKNAYSSFLYKLYNNIALLFYEQEEKEKAKKYIKAALYKEGDVALDFLCHNSKLIGLQVEKKCEIIYNQYNKKPEIIDKKGAKIYIYNFSSESKIGDFYKKLKNEIVKRNKVKQNLIAFISGKPLATVSELETAELQTIYNQPKEKSKINFFFPGHNIGKKRRVSLNSFICNVGKNCRKIEYILLRSLFNSEKYKILESQNKIKYFIKRIKESQGNSYDLRQALYFDIINQSFIEEIEAGKIQSPSHLLNARFIGKKNQQTLSFEVIEVKSGRTVMLSPPRLIDLSQPIENILVKIQKNFDMDDIIPEAYSLGIYYKENGDKGFIGKVKNYIQLRLREQNIALRDTEIIKNIMKIQKQCQLGVSDDCVEWGKIRQLSGIIFINQRKFTDGSFFHIRIVSLDKGTIIYSGNGNNIEQLSEKLAKKIKNIKPIGRYKVKFLYNNENSYITSLFQSKLQDMYIITL